MATVLMPMPRQAFGALVNGVWVPLNGGKLFAYDAGTTTPKDTYTTSAGNVANTNPIVLNARGEPDNGIYLGSGSYKFVLKDSTETTTYWTQDNVAGVTDSTSTTWCGTAGGTADALTLTPSSAIAAYSDGQIFQFIPASANTGAVTVAASGLGTKAITRAGTTALGANDLVAGRIHQIQYDGTRFQLLVDPLNSPAFTGSPTAPTQAATDSSTKIATTAHVASRMSANAPVLATARNAKMTVATASASSTFTADEIIVETALGGTTYKLSSYSQAINLATNGAGGMDTGGAPVSGFVSLYAIYNPTTSTASILACSTATSTASIYGGANIPSGYTASALIGVWPTDGSAQFKVGHLRDRKVWFVKANARAASSGNATSFTSLSISSIVPPNASTVSGVLGGSGTDASVAIAGDASGTGDVYAVGVSSSPAVPLGSFQFAVNFTDAPLITAQTIYYKANSATTNIRIDLNAYTF